MELEYNPYNDEDFGKRDLGRLEYATPWLRDYFDRLYRGWPAGMAAIAANMIEQKRRDEAAQG